ncbi:MAG: transposase [Planctomycetaceae bacterium]|nr:transposase [Planctomycetaceae bacterium]
MIKLVVKPQPKARKKPYDNVLVCKVLVLKYLYNLSDEQTELQIRDRLSFQHFLGLTRADKIPASF